MNKTDLYRWVIRRETHSGRTAAVTIVLVILAIAAVWFGAEIVLHLLGLAPLLIAPADLAAEIAKAGEIPEGTLIGTGIGALLVGLVLVLLGVLPGRRGKHGRANDRTALLVDDRVIASGLAVRSASVAGTAREQVRVSVGRVSADVTVTPASGIPIDHTEVQDAVEGEITDYDLFPRMRTRVRVSERGAVGV